MLVIIFNLRRNNTGNSNRQNKQNTFFHPQPCSIVFRSWLGLVFDNAKTNTLFVKQYYNQPKLKFFLTYDWL
jgi:hypothetical protein